MPRLIVSDPMHRELLASSLEIAPDDDNLHAAIHALLADDANLAHFIRIDRHLREDDFDFMSPFAAELLDRIHDLPISAANL